MSSTSAPAPACRSVFRTCTEATTTEQYTQIWITLINQLERRQGILSGVQ